MDNITHSLFGYALGRACANAYDPADQASKPAVRGLIACGVLASNAPDFDFVTGFWAQDRRLSYLLEHRGFTHTVLFGVLLGVLFGLGCALALRVQATRQRLAICGLGALACMLHIAFDFLNDYGVHPFFPLDNHWYYGDSVFIVEPLLFVVLLPLPLLYAFTRVGRGLAAALSLGLVLLVFLAGLTLLHAVGVTALLIAAVWLQRQAGARARFALLGSVVVIATFATSAHLAKAAVRVAVAVSAPGERVLDIATSPVPANPLCHRALVVSLDSVGTYRARIAKTRLFGEASSCELLDSTPGAPLVAAGLASTRGVAFASEFVAPVAELKGLAEEQCDAEAMLRFLRIPYWMREDEGTVIGDLRYDRAPGIEFAERLLAGPCKASQIPTAPWTHPRADLLGR